MSCRHDGDRVVAGGIEHNVGRFEVINRTLECFEGGRAHRSAQGCKPLALIDHPAIATVFDGGTTPQGRPYFAMEYVKGGPITA